MNRAMLQAEAAFGDPEKRAMAQRQVQEYHQVLWRLKTSNALIDMNTFEITKDPKRGVRFNDEKLAPEKIEGLAPPLASAFQDQIIQHHMMKGQQQQAMQAPAPAPPETTTVMPTTTTTVPTTPQATTTTTTLPQKTWTPEQQTRIDELKRIARSGAAPEVKEAAREKLAILGVPY